MNDRGTEDRRRYPAGELPIVGERVRKAQLNQVAESGDPPLKQLTEQCRLKLRSRYTLAELQNPAPAEKDQLLALIREEIVLFNHAAETNGRLSLEGDPDDLARRVMDSILGLGPLEALLADQAIEDIYINGPDEVIVVGPGGWERRPVRFESERQLADLISRAVTMAGRRVDFQSPIVDAQLPDGSRLNVVIAPVAAGRAPYVTIRRHRLVATTMEDLLRLETVSPDCARFLEAAVRSYVSILVTGATGTGKTNTINCLSSYFDPMEPKLVIEDTRELQVKGQNVRYMVTRPPSVEGTGEITQAQLGKAALRMRPRRIVFGEVRDAEAWDMVNMGNTGHDGLIAGVHANNPRDAIDRLVNLCRRAVAAIPEEVILREVVRAVILVVHLRIAPHTQKRHVVEVAEVSGQVEGMTALMQPLFKWHQGQLCYTGARPQPRLETQLVAHGCDPRQLFAGMASHDVR
jgi:pilus assembly protein CpaF